MKRRLIRIAISALLGAGVGVFLTILLGGDWWHNVTVGLIIGLTSATAGAAIHVFSPTVPRPLSYAAGVGAGLLAGVLLHLLWPIPVPGGTRRVLLTVFA